LQLPRLLEGIGARVRASRSARGWTSADLARRSGLSPRFLYALERGTANISVERLAEVAQALEVSVTTLVSGLSVHADDADRLASLRGTARERAIAAALPPRPIALVGLRGAGKSTVGRALAARLGCPFAELDARVEERAGVRLAEVFEFGGPQRYRELERAVATDLLSGGTPCVLATGGSIVTDTDTWGLVRRSARTVWLKAAPAAHLARVEAQGDTRPMRGRGDALAELEAILAGRTPGYAQAELHVQTDGVAIEALVDAIIGGLALTG